MRRLNSVLLLCLSFIVTLTCAPAPAQTVDTAIVGTITDSSGAAIPGATVVVSSSATGIKKQAVTGSGGEYTISYLTPGSFDVTVSANGFRSAEQKSIVLQINQQARVNLVMAVAGQEQTIQVQGTQPLLQTEDASLGVVVGADSAANLPLNGRKFNDLAILTPGVTVYNPDNHSSSTDGSAISAYGSQVTWAQVNVDGVTMVNNRHAYINVYPSVDAIQEFKVLTGNAEAEYGGGAGTVTNIQLKTGTNAFHGNLFEFFRNTAMDARNFFLVAPVPKQVLKQNQFGGTVGGPIIKDRTFFFFSYEGLRSVEQNANLANVLSVAEENGDFSALLPATQLFSPYTGLPYPNNQIPVDPVAQNIAQKYIPLPNTSQNGLNYAGVTSGNESVNQYLVRLDHKINDNNQLAFHFLYAFRNFPSSDLNPNFTYKGTYPIYNVGLQYVHTFNAAMVNELRLGTDLEHVKQLSTLSGTGFTAASIGINGFVQPNGQPWPPPDEGFPVISSSDLIDIGSGTAASNLDASGTYQFVDNFTWTKGKHTLIFGADIRHNQDNATTDNTPYGQLNFNGSETGYDGADLILGVPSSVITPEGVPLTAARQWRDAWYFQDNWKATPKLTLNLGLRYDLWVPPHDNLDTSRTLNFNTSPPTVVNLPNPIWKITHKDFAPRLGVAYLLPHQFVVRAGYGITFYGGQFDNINILQLNPPVDPSFTLTNGYTPSNPPTATIQFPVSPSLAAANANVASLPMNDQHPDLYLQTYNLTVSKQFWSNVIDISYVGVKGNHQDTSDENFNTGPPQPASGNVNANRPYPTFGTIRLIDFSGGASSYNGLNIHFEHRFTHGLEFTGSYSWSHLLDNQGTDINNGSSETQVPASKEWASGLTDQRNYLTIAFVWELPKVSGGNAATRAVVNGWGINSIYQYISGSPLWLTQSVDGENNGNQNQRPDLVPGQPLHLAHRTNAEFFNTARFTEAIDHYGSAPRNAVTGVKNDPLTLAVKRVFPLPFEGQHLDFRFEAFNAFNHPQFAAPGVVQGSSTFGVITGTHTDNRDLQLALKYVF
jgi:Carboxypeptidase regulatory-like domain/TonB dependent receptor-like, beta-barrel/TonB-dependent Receptor Plug Domain